MKVVIKEKSGLRGVFRLKVWKKGVLIEEVEDDNLIVAGAKQAMTQLLAGQGGGKNLTSIGFGTNGNIPLPEDTALKDAFVKKITKVSFPKMGEVEFSWDLLTTEANGKDIIEFGLLLEDGTLFSRKTRIKPISKDSDIALEGQWVIIF